MATSVLIKLEHLYLLGSLIAFVTAISIWSLRSLESGQSVRTLPVFTGAILLLAVSLIFGGLLAQPLADDLRTAALARELGGALATLSVIMMAEVAGRLCTGLSGRALTGMLVAATGLLFLIGRIAALSDIGVAITTGALQVLALGLALARILAGPLTIDRNLRRLMLITLCGFAASILAKVWLMDNGHWASDQGPITITLPMGLVTLARIALPLAFAALVVLSLSRRNLHEFQRRAETDSLTDLTARGSLTARGESLLGRTRLDGRLVAVLMIDIDHFKSVNDRYGHAVGDRVLAHCARLLRSTLRPEAVLARYGGEEFCAIVPINGTQDAESVAERLRVAIQATPYRRGRSGVIADPLTVPLTVSIGGTIAAQGERLDAVLKIADQELYKAKHAGRNRISLARLDPAGDADLLLLV